MQVELGPAAWRAVAGGSARPVPVVVRVGGPRAAHWAALAAPAASAEDGSVAVPAVWASLGVDPRTATVAAVDADPAAAAARTVVLRPHHADVAFLGVSRPPARAASTDAATALDGLPVLEDALVVATVLGRTCLLRVAEGGDATVFNRSRDTAEIDWTAPWRWRAARPDVESGLVGQAAARDRLARHLDRAALLATGGTAVAALARISAILLHGPAGAGKSTLVRAVCAHAGVPVVTVSVLALLADAQGREGLGSLPSIPSLAPCLSVDAAVTALWLPDLALLEDDTDSEHIASTARAVAEAAAAAQSASPAVLWIAECRDADALPPALRAVFATRIDVSLPTLADRRVLFERWMPAIVGDRPAAALLLARRTAGFSGRDVQRVCRAAALQHLAQAPVTTDDDVVAQLVRLTLAAPETSTADLLQAVRDVRGSGGANSARVEWDWTPPVTAPKLAGYAATRARLHQLIEGPIAYPEAFDRLGIPRPRGVLLYGPPGCGKTALVHALLRSAPVTVLAARAPDLFSRFLGESERSVRRLFAAARERAPSVIFLDELDALAAMREVGAADAGNGVGERVLSQLLNEMDGIATAGQVLVVACTNRPDRLDAALIRPGRLDQLVHVPLPSLDDRRDILEQLRTQIPTATDVDVGALAASAYGLSGASLAALYRYATAWEPTTGLGTDKGLPLTWPLVPRDAPLHSDAALDALASPSREHDRARATVTAVHLQRQLRLYITDAKRPAHLAAVAVCDDFAGRT